MNIPSLQSQVSAEEWQLRTDLAACYRLVALYGWSDLVFTHISARIPGPDHHFLINPYGMMFDEITASSLIKVDQKGNKRSESPFPVNPAGFTIHSCIHDGRPDVGDRRTCVAPGVARDAASDHVRDFSGEKTNFPPGW
ncbi:MAG: hypothetical protein RL616_1758 [Verrucomicrobiota bacterium]